MLINCTAGILEEMEIRPGFQNFVATSVTRHLAGDWGEVEPEDAEHNRQNPIAALSAYIFEGDVKVYVKSEFGNIQVFLPEEC